MIYLGTTIEFVAHVTNQNNVDWTTSVKIQQQPQLCTTKKPLLGQLCKRDNQTSSPSRPDFESETSERRAPYVRPETHIF